MLKKIILFVLALAVILGFVFKERITNLYHVLTLFDEDKIVHNFSHMQDVFYHSDEMRGASEFDWVEHPAEIELPDTYIWKGESKSVKAWLDETSTTSLLVLKEGAIHFEEYYQGTDKDDKRISWSMAKSFLSAVFGIAVDQDLIDIKKTVTDYLPEFKGTAYEDVPIVNVLNMASGVAFDEDYLAFNSDINKMGRVLALGGSMDEFAQTLTKREREPGSNRHYVSIDTHVLSMILRRVTDTDLRTYLLNNLWSKIGSQNGAYYLTDGDGVAFALGGLNMSTRDYAAFGQLFLLKGQWAGEQVIPEWWAIESTLDTAPEPASNSPFGYGYQWWLPPGSKKTGLNDFTAGGIYGQFIYVSPKHNVVIVKTSAHRGFRDDGQSGSLIKHETMEMFRAIAASM